MSETILSDWIDSGMGRTRRVLPWGLAGEEVAGNGLDLVLSASRFSETDARSVSFGSSINSGESSPLPHSSIIGIFPLIARNAIESRKVAMPPTLG